jgi:hypothetical protein
MVTIVLQLQCFMLLLLQFLAITDRSLKPVRFEKYLAAEALRASENDVEKALDLLTTPEQNCALQVCFVLPLSHRLLWYL